MCNMDFYNFTAIDFETMTAERTSACAVGIVRVESRVITQKFYSLIRPIPDDRNQNNARVHGITPEMVANAPDWGELWPNIEKYFSNQVIVCHNGDFDFDVLHRLADYYNLHFAVAKTIDTMMITNSSLADACALAGIPLENHHDALCDATACANLMLSCMGMQYQEHHYEKMSVAGKRKRVLSSEAKTPMDASEVEDCNTPFFQQKIVLTGILDSYPMREDLANLLKRYGADINTSISAKTNMVIVGHGAGPSKLKKIDELNAKGADIRVIDEHEFIQIIVKYGIH